MSQSLSLYKQSVADVVSQAAIHLHNSLGPIGTALIDSYASVIFDNNALSQIDDTVLSELIERCLVAPSSSGIDHITADGITVRAILLDIQHIFIIVGRNLESATVNGFVAMLRQVLPKSPLTDD